MSSILGSAGGGSNALKKAEQAYLSKIENVFNKIADCAPHPAKCRDGVSKYMTGLNAMMTDYAHADMSTLSKEIISLNSDCGLK